MTEEYDTWWDEAYEGDPPWDTGRPQNAFVRLAEAGRITGRVLDVGCGTGTHALYFAGRSHPVVGVDISLRAIERAELKAAERGLDVTFRVADVLELGDDLGTFDSVVDSGMFHVFDRVDRPTYADVLARLVESGGHAFVLAFGDDAPDDAPPTLVARSDFADAFGEQWRVREVREEPFETQNGSVPGYLAIVERV